MTEAMVEFLRKHGLGSWKRPPGGVKKCESCERYYDAALDACPYC